MKRLMDIVVSFIGLAATLPLLIPILFLVWRQDRHSPFYIAPRVGKDGKTFSMVKIRSMTIWADKSGVDSTAGDDPRITGVGRFIRRFKIDEISQLWNVLKRDMSLVGPRPNVQRDVALYTQAERALLKVRPGITDLASIVFADEGEILKGYRDPDLAYNQLIRPWKSRLGLLYVERRSLFLDVQIILLTAAALLSRNWALRGVQSILAGLGADAKLKAIASRQGFLAPYPPPGSAQVVMSR